MAAVVHPHKNCDKTISPSHQLLVTNFGITPGQAFSLFSNQNSLRGPRWKVKTPVALFLCVCSVGQDNDSISKQDYGSISSYTQLVKHFFVRSAFLFFEMR